MIISVDEEKAFDKVQHSFMIKALKNLGLGLQYLSIINAISHKHTVYITLNGEKNTRISFKVRNETKCILFTLLFNVVLDVMRPIR
jgi:hypothetical protein